MQHLGEDRGEHGGTKIDQDGSVGRPEGGSPGGDYQGKGERLRGIRNRTITVGRMGSGGLIKGKGKTGWGRS